MNRYTLLSLCLLALQSLQASAMGDDNPILTKVMLNQLEVRETEGPNPVIWDAEVSVGGDLNKVWLKTDGEHADDQTHSASARLLYGRAVTAYWDALVGVRHDFEPVSGTDWLELSVQGMAPYFIETEVSLFWGESGHSLLAATLEKELPFTQHWILVPELELTLSGYNDETEAIGSGLSSVELSVRLLYQVGRQLSPYVGVSWEKSFGNTADYLRSEGEDVSDTQLLLGVMLWF